MPVIPGIGGIGGSVVTNEFPKYLSVLLVKTAQWRSLAEFAHYQLSDGHIATRGVGSYQFDTDDLFTRSHRFVIQVASVASASCSVIVAAVVLFWFVRMKKRFRHKLIMLLVTGDLIRAVWYMIFACVTFGEGRIDSARAICQASGFLIQLGTEMTDFSVLFISIHGAVQIFNPAVSSHGSDFFHKNRHFVYATIIIVPIIFSALPFTNPYEPGYMSQGAFCSLPIRPIWFRLALAWIPRYIIWIIIFVLALAIYIHVRTEFKAVEASQRQTSETLNSSESRDTPEMRPQPDLQVQTGHHDPPEMALRNARDPVTPSDPPSPMDRAGVIDGSFFSPLVFNPSESTYKPSTMDSSSMFVSPQFNAEGPRGPQVRISIPTEAPTATAAAAASASPRDSSSVSTFNRKYAPSFSSWRTGSFPLLSGNAASPVTETKDHQRRMSIPSMYSQTSAQSCNTRNSMATINTIATDAPPRRNSDAPDRRMAAKRRRIQRQLRSIFVYPVVYVCMWLVPFVVLCFQYSDYWAQNPPWILTTLSNVCLCSMGAVNGIVFALREKPWLHIPGAERSFWASFAFWRREWDDGGAGGGAGGAGERGQRPEKVARDAEDAGAGASHHASVSTMMDRTGSLTAASVHRKETRGSWRTRGSDNERAAREMAYERLAKEKADRIAARSSQTGSADEASLDGRRASVFSFSERQMWDRTDLALMGRQGRRGSTWTQATMSIGERSDEDDEDGGSGLVGLDEIVALEAGVVGRDVVVEEEEDVVGEEDLAEKDMGEKDAGSDVGPGNEHA